MDVNISQQHLQKYVESRILSAHPVEVVAMLYEVVTRGLTEAIEHLQSGDRFRRARAVTRAEQAIHELLASLDHSVDPVFTSTCADLYRYALQRIVAGHARESREALEEAFSALKPVADAWNELRARMLQNSATGESDFGESLAETGAVKDVCAAYHQESGAVESRHWSA